MNDTEGERERGADRGQYRGRRRDQAGAGGGRPTAMGNGAGSLIGDKARESERERRRNGSE